MRYTEEERHAALDVLEASGGNYDETSKVTGVSLRTLFRWAKQERTSGGALRRVRTRFKIYRSQTKADPRQEFAEEVLAILMDDAIRLASLNEGIEDAPLNQRVAALNQILDKILKLMDLVPPIETKITRVEFIDCDGTVHETPYWSRSDPDEQGEV